MLTHLSGLQPRLVRPPLRVAGGGVQSLRSGGFLAPHAGGGRPQSPPSASPSTRRPALRVQDWAPQDGPWAHLRCVGVRFFVQLSMRHYDIYIYIFVIDQESDIPIFLNLGFVLSFIIWI
jgi:hypothetical protein